MDEHTWLTSPSGIGLLSMWRKLLPRETVTGGWVVRTPERKHRLFAVAVFRKLEHLFKHDWHRFALDATEEAAEHPIRETSVVRAVMELHRELGEPAHPDNPMIDLAVIQTVRPHELWEALEGELVTVGRALAGAWGNRKPPVPSDADLLRCIVGNPFRSVAFEPAWRSETVVALAAGVYAERAFDRLPILADALEEAGCDNADVLAHCRDPHQPHARGCWVVDLVLNKS
ncbi:MAG: hypothetical protein ABGY75_02360 [Gemmataceae bacterium]